MLSGKVSPGKCIHLHAFSDFMLIKSPSDYSISSPHIPTGNTINRVDTQDKFLNKKKMYDHYNSGLTPLNFFTLYFCYLSVYKLQISFHQNYFTFHFSLIYKISMPDFLSQAKDTLKQNCALHSFVVSSQYIFILRFLMIKIKTTSNL